MGWMRSNVCAFAVLAFAFAAASPSAAQQTTSTITGRAVDTSGGALPGVAVSIASPQMIGGARTAVTGEQGVYRFTLLPAGSYTVTFTLSGFSTLTSKASPSRAARR
jgi:carboxypeptidase family protein